jgi:flavin-dependent dehydrogenase
MSGSDSFDVVIAGAGPAGSSAAIHLAASGARVALVEQKAFPREKLCGEFISPECVIHFEKLGVAQQMILSEPALIRKTVFYSSGGHSITVPSGWFGSGDALGLSRAAMDDNLLRRAQDLGVTILENTTVTEVIAEGGWIRGVRLKRNGAERECGARLTIDATGRSRSLARRIRHSQANGARKSKSKLVAFKAHLESERVDRGVCEIYSYPRGYGGLSGVEGGLSNVCFIVSAKDVRRCHSNPEKVLRETMLTNQRAACVLEGARRRSEWLSVSLEGFGRQEASPAHGLLAIGDSAAFIDPFTGSGMLMALESGELVSEVIVRHLDKLGEPASFAVLATEYNQAYRRKFDLRLRMCHLLRHTAFRPHLAAFTIALCGASERLRSRIACATRSQRKENRSLTRSIK